MAQDSNPKFEAREAQALASAKLVNGVLFRGVMTIPDDGVITVIDPCYIPDSMQGGVVVKTDWYERHQFAAVYGDYENGRPKWIAICVEPSLLHTHPYGMPPEILRGHAGVDSGQIVFIGGDALKGWVDGAFCIDDEALDAPGNDYEAACQKTLLTAEGGGLIKGDQAFVTATLNGDGQYPVYYDFHSIIILFDSPEEGEDEGEDDDYR